MADFILELKDRSLFGSSNANRYRKQAYIPVSISCKGEESVSSLVVYDDFLHLAQKAKSSQVFTFKSDNKKIDGKNAIVKFMQKEYLKDRVLHVDFQMLKKGEDIVVRVPLKIIGTPVGVKNQGGILTPGAREIKLKVASENIPDILDVDVTSLKIGESVLAGGLKLPEGAKLLSSERESLAAVIESRASKLAGGDANATATATTKGAVGATSATSSKDASASKGKK